MLKRLQMLLFLKMFSYLDEQPVKHYIMLMSSYQIVLHFLIVFLTGETEDANLKLSYPGLLIVHILPVPLCLLNNESVRGK